MVFEMDKQFDGKVCPILKSECLKDGCVMWVSGYVAQGKNPQTEENRKGGAVTGCILWRKLLGATIDWSLARQGDMETPTSEVW
jgi:hypothetical protein